MITITVKKGEITARGHADYAPVGADIVCASISTLLQTLACSAVEMRTDAKITAMTAGDFKLEYEHLSETLSVLIGAFIIGIQGVAEAYPENVKVNIEQALNS